MKRNLILLVTLILPLLIFLVGCNNENDKPDEIVVSGGITDIVFTSENTENKTLKFNSTAPWTIALGESDWVVVTPSSGQAGEASVTIRLVDSGSIVVDRETTATITAGTAVTSLRILQTAPPQPIAIRIVAPYGQVPIGKEMNLTIEADPANAFVGEVEWESSDIAILTVESDGKVTGVAEGTAVVTATKDKLSAQCTIEVVGTFTTDNSGQKYTFKQLSEIGVSGVTVENGSYVMNNNIIINVKDALTLADAEQVKLRDGVEIRILGSVEFTPATSASIEAYDASSVPKPIYFSGDQNAAGGIIRNVTFKGVPIRYFSGKPLTIENCKFTAIASKTPAINLGQGALITVSKCEFIENESSAIAGGSNMTTPLIFKDNYLYKNSKSVSNRPQINVTVAGDGKVEIKGNTIIGPGEITMNGGIAVANLLGLAGTNVVLIEDNKVSDCRYGITTNGMMDVKIVNNVLENNKWESNPNNGGSGVSVYNSNGGQKVYMSGNTIKGHLWGITLIGNTAAGKGPIVNMGNLTQGADYNIGGNILKDNGNGGKLYDLYNNSPITVYAQGNTWNVSAQTEANIETVISHKKDDAKLGEVIFMPAAK